MNYKYFTIVLILLLLFCVGTAHAFTLEQTKELDKLYTSVNYSFFGQEYVAWVNEEGVFLDGIQTWFGRAIYYNENINGFRYGAIVHSHPPFLCGASSIDMRAKGLLADRSDNFYVQCGIGLFKEY
jgi:hypothetical protein